MAERAPKEPTTLDISTLDSETGEAGSPPLELALTVLLHPDPSLLGARALCGDGRVPIALARGTPRFELPEGGGQRPLDSARVSRSPLWIQREAGLVLIRAGRQRRPPLVDGSPLSGTRRISWERIAGDGVLIALGGCVLIRLHLAAGPPPPIAWRGLIGISAPMIALRERITRLARVPAPVLIRGESGSGKELIARALHDAGERSGGPWIAVNMSAIPLATAAAELFGHGRGAFTGAVSDRLGWFERAEGGTLFLDEIGETPAELQPQLLRVLDSGSIQPVGRQLRRVDLRLVAATDAELEAMVRAGRFRKALLYRLQSAEIGAPPLRDRMMDLPLLLHHFLSEQLRELGSDRLAEAGDECPWLGAELVMRLMRCSFPGNVRQLRSAALAITSASCDRRAAALPADILERLGTTRPAPSSERRRGALTEALVREALRRNRWVLSRAAADLGVAKNTLVAAIDRSEHLRLPRDLSAEEIAAALERAGGSVPAAAAALEVSEHGLRLQLRALGL